MHPLHHTTKLVDVLDRDELLARRGVDMRLVRRNWLPVSDSGKPRSADSPKRLGRRHELAMCNVMLRIHIVRLEIL